MNGLLEKYSETEFQPCGKDETGSYMVIEDCVVHVRAYDVPIVKGQALKDIWPLINKVQRV